MTINIGWEYFLGIVSVLIAGAWTTAWYSSHRFTALETSMEWVKGELKFLRSSIRDLKLNIDNIAKPLFGARSPVSLNKTGVAWLSESGLKEYVDAHQAELMKLCDEKQGTNPYEVQIHVFHLFEDLALDPVFDDKLKRFAFEKGTTISIMRRVGAIYFRDICLQKFGMRSEDIDKHDPEAKESKS